MAADAVRVEPVLRRAAQHRAVSRWLAPPSAPAATVDRRLDRSLALNLDIVVPAPHHAPLTQVSSSHPWHSRTAAATTADGQAFRRPAAVTFRVGWTYTWSRRGQWARLTR